MRHVRSASPASAFLLGVLLTVGVRGTTAIAADFTNAPPCQAPSNSADVPSSEAASSSDAAPPAAILLRISEILPDPAGKDADGEFIEIENFSDADVGLEGWRVADAKGKTYVIPAMRIAARGSRAFLYAETKIALVNAAASYTLQDANGVIVDVASYPSPVPEGKSYARFEGGWRWTEMPTPGAANVFSETIDVPPTTAPEPTETVAPPPAPTPTPPQVAPEPSVPEATPKPPAVTIDEILPNPDGDDATEWVELRNDGNEDAALAGWMLDDAEGGSAPYAFSTETVPAGGRLVVLRAASRLALNNDVDDVRLTAPDGTVRQSVHYADAPSGKTFAYDGTQWRWTTPTPGEASRFDDATMMTAAGTTAVTATSSEEEAVTDATIEEAAALDDDTMVSVSGIVTLPPGIVGKTLMAIRDSDGEHGAFVRIRGKTAIAMLQPGDTVMLRGRVRRDSGSLLSVNAKEVRKTGRIAPRMPPQRDPASVTEDDIGLAVAVAGTITAKGAGWVRLGAEGDGTEIRGAFAKGVIVGGVEVGDTATMTGVVRFRSGKPEIAIFEKGAFVAKKMARAAGPEKTATSASSPSENRETIVLSAKNGSPMPLVWTVIAAVSLGGAAAGYALWKRRRFA